MNATSVANPCIKEVLVLGGGSAGFLSAITLKVKLPHLKVTVLRSKELGIIGVGEGTTTTVPYHLHEFLKLPVKSFYQITQPTWKLGIRFIWGTRPYFNFIFGPEMDARHKGMRKGAGCNFAINFLDPDGHQFEIYCDMDQVDASGRLRPQSQYIRVNSLDEAIARPVPKAW